MTGPSGADDLHRRAQDWLADPASRAPGRDIAVHAVLCRDCLAAIGALDGLADVDVTAAGKPPPPDPVSPWLRLLGAARVGGAMAGALLAGVVVATGGTQLMDLREFAASLITPTASPTAVVATLPPTLTPGPTPTAEPSLPIIIPGTASPTPTTSWAPPATPWLTPTHSPTPKPTATPSATPVPTPTSSAGPTVPGAPSLAASAGIGQITLTWTTPGDGGSPILGYNVYRDGALLANYLAVSGSPYVDSTVTPGTAYSYYVTAANAVGEGAASNTDTATPPTVPGAPSLVATDGIGQVDLSWSVPANGGSPITGYDIYRDGVLLVSGLGSTSYTDTVAAGTYAYYVVAVNAVGGGPASNTVAGTSS